MKKQMTQVVPSSIYRGLRYIRNAVHNTISLIYCALWDLSRLLFHSGIVRQRNNIYHLVKDYHKIEKGLALDDTRPLFGRAVVGRLTRAIDQYEESQSDTRYHQEIRNVTNTLWQYVLWHEEYGYQEEVSHLRAFVVKHSDRLGLNLINDRQQSPTNVPPLTYSESQIDTVLSVIRARRSVRNFRHVPLTDDTLHSVKKFISRVPSVCNRQMIETRILRRKEVIDQVLTLQTGNRGFREHIYTLFVVTVDEAGILIPEERNQAFFDAGLFTSQLLIGLTVNNVYSCPLNWCVSPKKDRRISQLLDLDVSERVVVMVAAGYQEGSPLVTASPQRKDQFNVNEE